jgi:tripartite ATP-independent transporter DctM subunit
MSPNSGLKEKITAVLSIWPFLVLIFIVLGVIWLGIATPPEAAVFGASGALLINLIYRRLTWAILKESLDVTVKLTGMGLWILIGANLFVNVFNALGCQKIVTAAVIGLPGGELGVILMMMLVIMFLGMVMDDWAIIMLITPLYVPILIEMGISTLWFGVLFIVNIQIAYLSPPFGFVLFWLKGVLPKDVTMGDIYRSVFPFIIMQIIGLGLIIAFPQIALWLPSMLMK